MSRTLIETTMTKVPIECVRPDFSNVDSARDVFGPLNDRLGDSWCFLNCMMQLTKARPGHIWKVSRLLRRCWRTSKLDQLVQLVQGPRMFEVVDALPTRVFRLSDGYRAPANPCTIRHVPRPLNYVVSQLRGGHHYAAKKQWYGTVEQFRQNVRITHGMELIDISELRMPIREITRIMAHGRAFIGIDSGWAHLAHSVGLPVAILQRDVPVDPYHVGKEYRKVVTGGGLRRALVAYQDGKK